MSILSPQNANKSLCLHQKHLLTHYQRVEQPSVHIYGYSLYEFAHGEPSKAADLLIRQHPSEWCLIVEPGDQSHARFLQEVRDLISTSRQFTVRSPCPTATSPCPMSHRPKDWCHFRVHHQPGPLESRILDKAGRSHSWVSYSYLLLGPPTAAASEGPVQVLAIHPEGKAKLRLHLCTGNKILSAEVLKRNKTAYREVNSLEPGDRVQFRPGVAHTPSGDTIRIMSPDDFDYSD